MVPWSPAGEAHTHLAGHVAQALAVDTGQVNHSGIEAYLNDDSADHLHVIELACVVISPATVTALLGILPEHTLVDGHCVGHVISQIHPATA